VLLTHTLSQSFLKLTGCIFSPRIYILEPQKTAHFFVVLRKMFLNVLSTSYEAVHSMDNFNFVRNGLIESCEVILITSHTSLHFAWTPRIAFVCEGSIHTHHQSLLREIHEIREVKTRDGAKCTSEYIQNCFSDFEVLAKIPCAFGFD
jgi:hypothetical protein